MLIRSAIVAFFLLAACSACATLASLFGSYDDRSLMIHTLDLFDQRSPPKGDYPDWKGDWIFRRDRLAAVDRFLRSEKPDILVMQNAMSRKGSPSESDTAILQAGALVGFEFESQIFGSFVDTQEDAALAVATSLPVAIAKITDPSVRRSWPVGETGYLTLTMVENEGQPISLFNVKMPDEMETSFQWYDFVYEKIYDHFRYGNYCLDRVIIAGYLPYSLGSERLLEMFESLNLQDVADEDCKLDSDCYTRSMQNGLGNLIDPSAAPGRVDKILVSSEAIVYGASRSFDDSGPATEYQKRWNLDKNWPSLRYGWSAEVKFPRCN